MGRGFETCNTRGMRGWEGGLEDNFCEYFQICLVLLSAITPMVLGAKSVAQNPQDPGSLQNWRNCNQHVSTVSTPGNP